VIETSTFLRNRDGSFQPFFEAVLPPPDPRYVEGAVELTVEGVELFGLPEWDLVDQLWAYLCNLLAEFQTKDSVRTGFPDSAIDLSLRRLPAGRVLVTCEMLAETRRVAVAEEEFVRVLSADARSVLARMSRLLPENSAGYEKALGRLPK
jgi:hypothetical protein